MRFAASSFSRLVSPFQISLIFEINEAMRKHANEAFNLVLKHVPHYAEVLKDLSFGDKKRYKPLQAADALAYDLNKQFTSLLHEPNAQIRKSLRAMLETMSPFGMYWPWPYEDLRRLFSKRYRALVEGKPVDEDEDK